MKLRLLLLLFSLCSCFNAFATHIVGGEFELQHLTGYNYRLILHLYFDDINGDPNRKDNFVRAGIFEKGTDRSIKAIQLPIRGSSAISYSNVSCTTSDLKTSKITYSESIYLDPAIYNSPNGYYVASEICCRNSPINNMAPGEAGTTYYMEFPAVVMNGIFFKNSSPQLPPPISDYACAGELFYYNLSGTDADGDKLVYDLVTPLSGHSSPGDNSMPPASSAPYPEIEWLPGHNKNNQILGSPALSIDNTTGRLTVRPGNLGLFVFGVRCQEFRNGVKIGEVRRDFQLLVKDCLDNETPQVSALVPGSTKLYQEGQVLRISATDSRCIKVLFTDPDKDEQISIAAQPVNFNNSYFSLSNESGVVNGGNQEEVLEALLCLDKCFDTKGGIYLLNLIVSDNGDNACSLPKQDTLQLSLLVEPVPNHPPGISLSTTKRVMEVSGGDIISFDVTGTDLDNEEITVSATGKNFDISSQNITFEAKSGIGQASTPFTWQIDCEALQNASYQIEFTVTSASCGSQVTKTEIIEVITVRHPIGNNSVTDNQALCFGETPQPLTGSLPTGGKGPFIYSWEVSTSGSKDGFMPAPGTNNEQHYTPPILGKTAWYRRKVTSGLCNESISETAKITTDVIEPDAGEDITIIQGSVAGLKAKGGEIYSWSPATGLSDPNILNPIAKPVETTTYTVTMTAESGCTYTDEVTITVLPRLDPTNTITLNGDNINDNWHIRNVEFYPNCRVQVFTRWGAQIFDSKGYQEPWDGTQNGEPLPMAAYYYIIDLGMKEKPISGTINIIK
ncbi:gliding motility-associated C-terminal domain-containing protein [Pontibacter pamirensis]|uniref:gliding motility-associated C-terminal domain-containing protein n=1 Tax=Pontibacter pamirensis TaxID=2562824 RepID=UPI00138A37DB|nr:gliding motility-associated C-terminal domain-containing protein [Pontibacter pamirensis]